jgi:hypothetical protein
VLRKVHLGASSNQVRDPRDNVQLFLLTPDTGYGKESGKDVAVEEYLITKTGTLTIDEEI